MRITLKRQPEIDALRGLFLVWMVLTHLPTHMSDFVNQPFGFVSSAEGFVFVSAMLTSRLYLRQSVPDEPSFHFRIWRRALQLYGFHLVMLLFAFTVAAALAVHTNSIALHNLLNFYLAHPAVAIVGSIFLVYTPPLLDILPMYVLFLAFSPPILSFARRYGWRIVMAASGLLWLGGQLGLRALVHAAIVRVTHLHIPLQETGAFNLFSWQLVWTSGLWLGARSARPEGALPHFPPWATTLAAAICVFCIGIRHDWLGKHLTVERVGVLFDKWQLTPLRILNLLAFVIVCWAIRDIVKHLLAIEPLLTLGRASLEVFCAHIFFCFVGLALLYQDTPQLHGWRAAGLLVITFTALIWIAAREVRKRRAKKRLASQQASI
jgi:hypothetical protein